MVTRYPDYHGEGYYNFIIDEDERVFGQKVEDNSHDFVLDGVTRTRHKSIEDVIKQYPTKVKLNNRYFKEK